MATQVLPTPRRRGWQLALCELLLMLAVMIAFLALRFGHDTLLLLRYQAGPNLALLGLGCVAAMYALDLYESPVIGDLRELGARLPQALGLAVLLLAAAEDHLPGLSFAQRTWVEALLTGGFSVCLFRASFLFWHHHPRLSEPVLLVGDSTFAAELHHVLSLHGEIGLPVVGTLSSPTAEDLLALTRRSASSTGATPDLARRLIAAFPHGWNSIDPALRRALERAGYRLDEGAEVYERLTGKLPLEALRQCDPGFRAAARISPLTLGCKRALDLLIAGTVLALVWPVMTVVALLIRLDSPGPAIFRQPRVGRNGNLFTVYKFRSMRVNADAGNAPRPAGDNDPRCTRLGRWLRRLRLDELPQLWNILRGDMSLVGPRPFVPQQEEDCLGALPFYDQRWSVPPGATGWAQVNRGYCASLADNADKLAYDLFYVRNLSLSFDLLILLQTFKVLLMGRGGR